MEIVRCEIKLGELENGVTDGKKWSKRKFTAMPAGGQNNILAAIADDKSFNIFNPVLDKIKKDFIDPIVNTQIDVMMVEIFTVKPYQPKRGNPRRNVTMPMPFEWTNGDAELTATLIKKFRGSEWRFTEEEAIEAFEMDQKIKKAEAINALEDSSDDLPY